jgi:hypothetical protein
MRLRNVISLLLAIVVLSTATTHPAQADAAPACGKTVEENLAVARQALQSGDTPSRAAFLCLIEATTALDKKLHEFEQAQTPGVLHAPVRAEAVQSYKP